MRKQKGAADIMRGGHGASIGAADPGSGQAAFAAGRLKINGAAGAGARALALGDLGALLAASIDWAWETDAELRFSWVSEDFERVTGIDPGSVVGRFRFDFLKSSSHNEFDGEQHLADLQARHAFRDFAYRLDGGALGPRWVSTSGIPRFGPDGHFIGYRGTGRDVTQLMQSLTDHSRQQMEAQLAGDAPPGDELRVPTTRDAEVAAAFERAVLSDSVLNGVTNPVFVKDCSLNFVLVNESFAALFNLKPEDMIGRKGGDFVAAGDAEAFERSERLVLETGEPYEVEEDFEFSGIGRARLVRKNRIRTNSGKDYIACTIVDVTDMKRRETQLLGALRDNEVFRNIIDNVPVSIYAKRPDLRLLYVNKGWCELMGLSAEQAIGRTDLELFGDVAEPFLQGDIQVLESGRSQEIEETVRRPDASVRYQFAKKGLVTASDGSLYLIGSTMDISELKQREFDLVEARQKAILADRAKSEFLANMSHEIRTPMNGVMGMAELLAKTNLDPKQRTFTDIIVKSGNALLTIINDILDFSKIDAGQLVLDPAPFKLAQAVEDVATLMSTRAREKDIELIVRLDPDCQQTFVGDAGRIRQITANLLGNAVKFTDSGHVLIDVTSESCNAAETRLRIAITDTGIGIPADKLKLVFEKFSQVDGSSTRRHEGTGLGLAITARLVDLMGGTVGVESEEGRGSTFWFTLTLKRAPDTRVQRAAPVDVTGARVLVIDDNAVNRAILAEQMASWQFDSCACESGAEGIDLLKAAARHGLPVDCVVLDYQMPGMTGADAARIIRATPEIASTPILMLTSVDQPLAGGVYRDIGIEAQLTKPARSSTLLETIVGVIQNTRREPSTGPNVSTHSAMPVTAVAPAAPPIVRTSKPAGLDILVAEDNEVNQLVFTHILADSGYSFEIVDNGRKAVETYVAKTPRMILMDVSMPEMNGLQATETIRAQEIATGTRIPIVGVTAHALKGDRERCAEAGMDDYLPKPISPRALLEKVDRWMQDGEDRRDSARSPGWR